LMVLLIHGISKEEHHLGCVAANTPSKEAT
jgi:hypothetical protein